ncbi:MAG: hypothetical protein IPO18_06085 [bacterium]|nr:hypothetical protein [bacterium]
MGTHLRDAIGATMPAKSDMTPTPSTGSMGASAHPSVLDLFPHSGHYYYVLKKARAGFKPFQDDLMASFCHAVSRGQQPRPAVLVYIADAVAKVASGKNAGQAFGQVRDRAGKPPKILMGDFLPIIFEGKNLKKSMKASPAYRNWRIVHHVAAAMTAGSSLKSARKSAAKQFTVSDSTVQRAIVAYRKPHPVMVAQIEHFKAVEDAVAQFQEYVRNQIGTSDAKSVAASWRRQSIAHFGRLGRAAAAESPGESAEAVWFRKIVDDKSFVHVLFLRLEHQDVDGHPAMISELEAQAAFVRAINRARRRILRQG